MKIYFKTSSNQKIKEIAINQFDFDCNSKTLIYDLLIEHDGDINSNFFAFSSKINKEKIKFGLQSNNIQMPKQLLKKFYNYHKKCKCVNKH